MHYFLVGFFHVWLLVYCCNLMLRVISLSLIFCQPYSCQSYQLMTDTWLGLTWTRRVLLSLGVPPAAGPGHDRVYREVCGARSQRAVLLHHPSIAALSTCTVRQHEHVTGTALHASNLGRLPESTDSAAIFSVQREKRIRKLTGSERGRRDQFGNVPLTAVARGEGVLQVQGWSLRGDKLNSTSRSQTPLGLGDFMTRGRLLLISVLISVLTTYRSGGAALLVGDEAFLLAGGRPSPRSWRGGGGSVSTSVAGEMRLSRVQLASAQRERIGTQHLLHSSSSL